MGKKTSCNCSICNGKSVLFHDFKFSGLDQTPYYLFKCRECHMVFTGPRPTPETLQEEYGKYYWSDTDIQDEAKKGISRLVATFNSWRLKQVIRPLLKVLPAGATVLEVGCGAGQLSRILLKNGLNVEVTEYSPRVLDMVTKRLGIKGYSGDLTEIDFSGRYDAIIFNNVLEHVMSPLDNLKRAASLLNPDGLIFIEVPNINSLQFVFFKHRWYPLDIPVHLTHFSPKSLDNLAHKAGLTLAKRSFFSMRSSVAGIVVSLLPMFDPRNIRQKGAAWMLFAYLVMQVFLSPVAIMEGFLKRGGIMRNLYSKQT